VDLIHLAVDDPTSPFHRVEPGLPIGPQSTYRRISSQRHVHPWRVALAVETAPQLCLARSTGQVSAATCPASEGEIGLRLYRALSIALVAVGIAQVSATSTGPQRYQGPSIDLAWEELVIGLGLEVRNVLLRYLETSLGPDWVVIDLASAVAIDLALEI